MNGIVQWLENHSLTCWMKTLTGMDCPGCGFQRSLILLLRGDLSGSFIQYPGLLPTIFLLVFLVLHLIFQFKHGAKILLVSFVVTATMVMGNYTIKQIHFHQEKTCETK